MKPVKFLLEIIGWCQIAIGAAAFTALPAGLLYYFIPSETVRTIAVIIIVTGFIVGVTKIWIRSGTVEWLSRRRRIS